jgi:hypothetical protein
MDGMHCLFPVIFISFLQVDVKPTKSTIMESRINEVMRDNAIARQELSRGDWTGALVSSYYVIRHLQLLTDMRVGGSHHDGPLPSQNYLSVQTITLAQSHPIPTRQSHHCARSWYS